MKRTRDQHPKWVREEKRLTLDEIGWLRSPAGREVCRAMAEDAPADTPAAIAHWRQRLAPERVAAAWNQVALRASARTKFSRADDMLFDRVGLEQASDEVIAEYKAGRFAEVSRVADLCCGIGGDAVALAGTRDVVAVDWSEVRTAMAAHNAGVYGRSLRTRAGDVAFDWPEADAAHVDPDRRAQGRRSHDPDQYSPGLATLERIVRHYQQVAIKLSPGAVFDVLPFEAEIELISHHGECKQAVAWTGKLQRDARRATVFPSGESIEAAAGTDRSWPDPRPPQPGDLLLEPDPAVIRADLVGILARRHDLAPIDPHISWLVGSEVPPTSMVRTFRVVDVTPWSAKPARAWLARHDIGRLDIKTRGFAARPETILKSLRPTGRKAGVLFLTRIEDRPSAILAERLD